MAVMPRAQCSVTSMGSLFNLQTTITDLMLSIGGRITGGGFLMGEKVNMTPASREQRSRLQQLC